MNLMHNDCAWVAMLRTAVRLAVPQACCSQHPGGWGWGGGRGTGPHPQPRPGYNTRTRPCRPQVPSPLSCTAEQMYVSCSVVQIWGPSSCTSAGKTQVVRDWKNPQSAVKAPGLEPTRKWFGKGSIE
eukprot:jgi/Botrbrau1/17281/Bobra.0015s0038.1